MISHSAYADFEAASIEVLNYLQSRMGFRLWIATRTESDDWIVLNANDHDYNFESSEKIYDWTDSFGSCMVEGQGPRIVHRSDDVPAQASALIGQSATIGAYVSIPLTRSNGEIFGTLFAIGPYPMPDEITKELPLIELMARHLKTIFEKELVAQDEQRNAERAKADAMTDQLTGLYNRRGWHDLVAREDSRCRRYGLSAGILSIDLDGLKIVNDEQGHVRGDALLCKAANVMNSVARQSDVVARLGGDEFAVLAVESDLAGTEVLMNRLAEAFTKADVSASFGMSMRNASGSLAEAFDKADKKMYEQKYLRKRKPKHLAWPKLTNQ